MAANIKLLYQLTAILNDGTYLSSQQLTPKFVQVGSKGIRYNVNISSSDVALDLAGISTLGLFQLRNLAALFVLSTPPTPVITQHGTAGATNDSYKIVGKQSDGSYTAASAAGATSTANATLDTNNYNILTWTNDPNATSGYDIYRTVAGGTPNTTGKIGAFAPSTSTGSVTFNDTGLAGDASSPPSTAADNIVKWGDAVADYPWRMKGGDIVFSRANGGNIHLIRNSVDVLVEVTLLDD